MGCPTEVEIGDNLVFTITTHDPDTGVLTDTDSAPSYRVYEDETGTAILTGSMAKLDDANTIGFYSESIACTSGNGFENGKTYTVYIEATVDLDKGGICYGFKAYDQRKADSIQISGSATAANNAEIVYDTDFATNYSAANDKWQTEADVTAIDGTAQRATDLAEISQYLFANGQATLTTILADDSVIAHILAKDGAVVDYDDNTDSLEALRDYAAPSSTAISNATWTDARAGYLDNINGHTAQTGDSFARIGANGGSLTAVPWNSNWDSEVQSECNDALVALNLDHLCATATAGADMTTEVADNTILSRVLAAGDTSAFVPSTDCIQNLRDELVAVDANVDAVLVDTGTTLPATLTTIEGKIDTVDGVADAILVDTGTTLPATLTTIEGKIDTVDGNVDAILLDTGTDGVVVAAASKTGYALSATGLDTITATAPGGVASNFREMVVQLWRRFFKKATLTSTQLKTYADDGSTAETTQTVSDDGTTQTQGASS